MISYTLCNGDNYYTIKKTLQKTERTSDEEIPADKIAEAESDVAISGNVIDNVGVNHAGTL